MFRILKRKVVYLMMQHITGIHDQLFFLVQKTIFDRFIDAFEA
jgi:hypothetical protein